MLISFASIVASTSTEKNGIQFNSILPIHRINRSHRLIVESITSYAHGFVSFQNIVYAVPSHSSWLSRSHFPLIQIESGCRQWTFVIDVQGIVAYLCVRCTYMLYVWTCIRLKEQRQLTVRHVDQNEKNRKQYDYDYDWENWQTKRNETKKMRKRKNNKNEIIGISVASNQFHQIVVAANVYCIRSMAMSLWKIVSAKEQRPFWGSTKLILNFSLYFRVGFFCRTYGFSKSTY